MLAALQKIKMLQKAFELVGKRYKFQMAGSVFQPITAFKTDIARIWDEKGEHQTCNVQNYLLRFILVKSGFFKEEEIKLKTRFINFSIHQNMQVKLNGKWIPVDPWAMQKGIKIGQQTPWFIW